MIKLPRKHEAKFSMFSLYDIDELFFVVETRMGFKVANIIEKNHWLFQDFHSMIFIKKTQHVIFSILFHLYK